MSGRYVPTQPSRLNRMNCGTIATVGGMTMVAMRIAEERAAPAGRQGGEGVPDDRRREHGRDDAERAMNVELAKRRGTSRRSRTPARLARLGGSGKSVGGEA